MAAGRSSLAAWDLLVLTLAALIVYSHACAVPHGGCAESICARYWNVTPGSVMLRNVDFRLPSTWLKGSLPLIGYYVGLYNRAVNSGSYDTRGVPGTPALNYERFDLEYKTIDPRTGKPYAVPSVPDQTTLVKCCAICRASPDCWAFQYYYAKTDSPTGQQCYMLSGGTSDLVDFPERGLPFSGTHSQQSTGSQSKVPLSFIGGRCNGDPRIKDDPHFTGAKGVKFDFNGEINKSFCLTADKDIQVNALLKGYKDNRTIGASVGKDGKALRTWIKEVGLLWNEKNGRSHTLHLVARGGKEQARGNGFLASAVLDGITLRIPDTVKTAVKGRGMVFSFLGTTKKGNNEADHFNVAIKGLLNLDLTLRNAGAVFQLPDDAETHFNIKIKYIKQSDSMHGVLGQTYRNTPDQVAKVVKYAQIQELIHGPIQADGETGKGFLEGTVADYETTSIIQPDCKFSPFSPGAGAK